MADQGLPPPGRFITDGLVNLFKDRIAQLIADLGRDVTLILTPLQVDCPNCSFDFNNQRSSNIYTSNASGDALNKSFPRGQKCPVCQGKGKLSFSRTIVQQSLIGFGPAPEEFDYKAYGLTPDQVLRTKNKLDIISDLEAAQYAIIDGFECEKVTVPRKTGLRDLAFVVTYWKRRNT